jgi:hypothetical protein
VKNIDQFNPKGVPIDVLAIGAAEAWILRLKMVAEATGGRFGIVLGGRTYVDKAAESVLKRIERVNGPLP